MLLCKDCAFEVKIEDWDVYKDKKIPLCFPCLKVRFSFYENIAKIQRAKLIQEQSLAKAKRIQEKEFAKKEKKAAKEAEEERQRLIRKKFNEQYMCGQDDSET